MISFRRGPEPAARGAKQRDFRGSVSGCASRGDAAPATRATTRRYGSGRSPPDAGGADHQRPGVVVRGEACGALEKPTELGGLCHSAGSGGGRRAARTAVPRPGGASRRLRGRGASAGRALGFDPSPPGMRRPGGSQDHRPLRAEEAAPGPWDAVPSRALENTEHPSRVWHAPPHSTRRAWVRQGSRPKSSAAGGTS